MEGLTAKRVVPDDGTGQVFGRRLGAAENSVGVFEFLGSDEIGGQGLHGGVVDGASRRIDEDDQNQQTQVHVIRHDQDGTEQDHQRPATHS